MIQANGGNDTLDITGGIVDSTVYGGQGTDYISGVDGASTISGSLIAGNLGADSVILNSTTSIYNTEVYGSDSAGTDTGADSIEVGARTFQTTTVYGGAGADTLILGESATLGQFVDADIRAFAGNDSVAITGSFVSTTVRGGTGNDTINIDGDVAAGESSSSTAIYAGDGTDSIIAKGRGVTVFGGDTADSTSDGADSLRITNLHESTVYGASGADSFTLANSVTSVRIEGGADADIFTGSGVLDSTTILGGAAADSLNLTGAVTGGYFEVELVLTPSLKASRAHLPLTRQFLVAKVTTPLRRLVNTTTSLCWVVLAMTALVQPAPATTPSIPLSTVVPATTRSTSRVALPLLASAVKQVMTR